MCTLLIRSQCYFITTITIDKLCKCIVLPVISDLATRACRLSFDKLMIWHTAEGRHAARQTAAAVTLTTQAGNQVSDDVGVALRFPTSFPSCLTWLGIPGARISNCVLITINLRAPISCISRHRLGCISSNPHINRSVPLLQGKQMALRHCYKYVLNLRRRIIIPPDTEAKDVLGPSKLGPKP